MKCASPIIINDACTHNLKHLSCTIPRNKLVVVTGVSGSGKSSLVFDTIVAEAKRRLEFLALASDLEKSGAGAPVGDIQGLSFAVGLSLKESRSRMATVASKANIYNQLAALFLHEGEAHCPTCDSLLVAYSKAELVNTILAQLLEKTISILAPMPQEHAERKAAITSAVRDGFTRLWIDGTTRAIADADAEEIKEAERLAIVIDRITVSHAKRVRLIEALALALKVGQSVVYVESEGSIMEYPEVLRCKKCDLEFPVPSMRSLQYFRRAGQCVRCQGRGELEGERRYLPPKICPSCFGVRVSPIAAARRIGQMKFGRAFSATVDELHQWLETLHGPETTQIQKVLVTLQRLGIGYLALNRGLQSLSAGEFQRVRIAHALQSKLHGVLYALDEPSAGLDAENVERLVSELRVLQAQGASLLIIEHDVGVIKAADEILELGPGAGTRGGEIIAHGSPEVIRDASTATGEALREATHHLQSVRQVSGEVKNAITIINAHKHNLKNITVRIPLRSLVAVTGVSGSGKSSLITDTLVPVVQAAFAKTRRKKRIEKSFLKNFAIDGIEGWQDLQAVIDVKGVGLRLSTYVTVASVTGILSELRRHYAQTIEARARGLTVRDFSIGAKVTRSISEIRFKGITLGESMELSLEECRQVFQNFKLIRRVCDLLLELGLGYLRLSQQVRSLSGGEKQRLAIAKWLATARRQQTLFVFDEPSSGLHPTEVSILTKLFRRLVSEGNSVLVVEHNQALINAADYVVRLGPGAGERGGQLI